MTPTEIRLALYQRGYAPLPLNGKSPEINGKGWQVKRQQTNPTEIKLWETMYQHASNTGVLTRTTPFLDIDITNPAAAEDAEKLVKKAFDDGSPILVRIGKAPKRAIAFRCEKPFGKISEVVIGPDGSEQRIELLADGQQVVVHGVHPDTQRDYVWPGGSLLAWSSHQLPDIDETRARKLVREIVDMLVSEYGYKRKTHDTAEGGASADAHSWGSCLDNLISHDDIVAFAMKLLRSGMNDGAAVNFGRELIGKWAGDDDAPRKQRRLDEWPRAVQSARDKIGQNTAKPAKPAVSLTSYADLKGKAFMPLQYVVPKYIPEGLTLLAGKPKIGKSCLALAITLACARGEEVLGETCPSCDVVYFALEDTARRMQERTEKILGSNEDWPANAWHVFELPPLDKGCIDALDAYLKLQPAIKLMIIDTLVSIKGKRNKGEEPYAADYAAMKALLDFSHEKNVSIIVIHHVTKAKADDVFDTISGTLGLNGGADTLAVLTSKGKDDPLHFAVRGRDVGREDKVVDFDYEMGKWDVLGDWDEEDNASSKTRDLIKTALAGSGEMSPAAIAHATGLKEATVRVTMRRMTKDGDIKRTSYGAYHL